MDETLRKVTFTEYLFSLSSEALIHLGVDPANSKGKVEQDLNRARIVIETLDILKAKTSGNLDSREEETLKNILHDLKKRYVSEIQVSV